MSSIKVDPRNRLNDLNSRRWLQFQKSWFYWTPETPAEFIAFFTKKYRGQGKPSRIGVFPENAEIFQRVIEALGREPILLSDTFLGLAENPLIEKQISLHSQPSVGPGEIELDYVLVDLQQIFLDEESYRRQASRWLMRIYATVALMQPNSYLTIFLRNAVAENSQHSMAWEFGNLVGRLLAMKDEKIGCEIASANLPLENANATPSRRAKENLPTSGPQVVYCLNFRREGSVAARLEPALILKNFDDSAAPTPLVQAAMKPGEAATDGEFPKREERAWFIIKPPPREKNVLLHPAKFPEPLIRAFIERFTRPGERVFDPMAGTGSALMAALSCQREAYGIELNPAFCRIIRQRLAPETAALFDQRVAPRWQLQCGDASKAETYGELPDTFHYIITSPPYWDMLRMKGAHTQQQRKQAGLLQFYSDDERDLGNIADYEAFLESLLNLYRLVGGRLVPGRYMTIIVKNVKKKGKIFPLAWDLSLRLRQDFILGREQFWCQDDQKLAPFGYRYAWVSNTFHHYCLHFRKPG